MEEMTDVQKTLFLVHHIYHPCEIHLAGKTVNIRQMYIEEARRQIIWMRDLSAKNVLMELIEKYETGMFGCVSIPL